MSNLLSSRHELRTPEGMKQSFPYTPIPLHPYTPTPLHPYTPTPQNQGFWYTP
ncbi:MAG: hypothetical protein ACRAVC_18265 [Trichormus sp.]